MNIRTKFKKLIDKSNKEVFLTEQEKNATRFNLINFINNPLKEDSLDQNSARLTTWSLFSKPAFKYLSFASLIFVLIGYGVSFGANVSLPGEFLYPVKTN